MRMAVSIASEPELAKKTWSSPSGVISAMRAASSTLGVFAVLKKLL